VFSVRDCDPSHPTDCLSVRYFIAPAAIRQLFLPFSVTTVNHIKSVRCAGMWLPDPWKWRHQVSLESPISLTEWQRVISQKVWIFSYTSMRTWIPETTHRRKCHSRSNFLLILISARICFLQFKLCSPLLVFFFQYCKFEIGLKIFAYVESSPLLIIIIIPSFPLLSPLPNPCGDQYATSFDNHSSFLYPASSGILEADLQQPRPTVSQCNKKVCPIINIKSTITMSTQLMI